MSLLLFFEQLAFKFRVDDEHILFGGLVLDTPSAIYKGYHWVTTGPEHTFRGQGFVQMEAIEGEESAESSHPNPTPILEEFHHQLLGVILHV